MEIQVKTENEQDADTEVTDNKTHIMVGLSPNRITVASGNKRTGHKDYNSRYTSKYSHGQYMWTEQRIYDLIRLYKEYTEKNQVYIRNQKPMWESIASKMRELGHSKCTDNHCHTKYRTLIRQYRVISDRGCAPESRHLDFPYYDALSEVYDYTASNNTEADDIESEEDSVADNKLASLLVIINKDKKEQDRKRLEKLESMHREKMDMFSSFLKTVSKKPSEVPSPTRTSKRLSSSARKRSAAQYDDDYVMDSSDSSVDPELLESEKMSSRKRKRNSDQSSGNMKSLIAKMNEERKERDEKKMCRLEKMHDEKMKMFSAFLDVIKKIKK